MPRSISTRRTSGRGAARHHARHRAMEPQFRGNRWRAGIRSARITKPRYRQPSFTLRRGFVRKEPGRANGAPVFIAVGIRFDAVLCLFETEDNPIVAHIDVDAPFGVRRHDPLNASVDSHVTGRLLYAPRFIASSADQAVAGFKLNLDVFQAGIDREDGKRVASCRRLSAAYRSAARVTAASSVVQFQTSEPASS